VNLSFSAAEVPVRTRILALAGPVLAVCFACSQPGDEASRSIDEASAPEPGEVQLAITPQPTGTPVASEIEAPRPKPKPVVRRVQRERAAAKAEAPPTPAASATPEPEAAPRPEIALAAVPVAGPAPVRDPVASPDAPAVAAAPEDGDHAHAGEEREGWTRGGDRGPIVIIRGGRGGLNDPCAKHPPRPGIGVGIDGIGTLVNPRYPDPVVGDRGPRIGRPSFPRGGGIRY
jgi:hypothetical protein